MRVQKPRNSVEVLSILRVENETFVFVKLLSGNIAVDMILEEESGAMWRVVSFGYISAESHSAGVRSILIEAIDSASEIHPGMRLLTSR